MTALDVDAIEARANAATPGPWNLYRYPHGGGRICIDDQEQVGRRRELIADMIGDDPDAVATVYNEGDREFLLAAREDIPLLVAEVRRLRLALAGEQQVNGSARAARVRELEAAARVDYAALRVDVDNVSVSELAAAEARVVALAEAADVYEGVPL